jgi:hypothetical protein
MKGSQSLKTNQKVSFKFNNQSNTDLKSSPQVIKEKWASKENQDPIQKKFTDTSQANSRLQCRNHQFLQASNG